MNMEAVLRGCDEADRPIAPVTEVRAGVLVARSRIPMRRPLKPPDRQPNVGGARPHPSRAPQSSAKLL